MKAGVKILQLWWKNVKRADDRRMAGLTPAEGVEVLRDLDYAGDGEERHRMDLYRPEGRTGEPLPLIVDVHGGGWMYGDKDLNGPYCRSLASRGFAVASFSYSLFPDETLPVPVREIFAAINHLHENAGKYGIDADNMFLTGDSAGGHYAGLVCGIMADESLQRLYDVRTEARFNAVGFTCAAFYPNDIGRIPVPIAHTYMRLFYGGDRKFKENPFYATNDVIDNPVEKFPPMFINSCHNDMMKGQNLKFMAALDERKIPYERDFPEKKDCVNKMGHVYSVLYPEDWEEARRTNDRLCDFFRRHMNP